MRQNYDKSRVVSMLYAFLPQEVFFLQAAGDYKQRMLFKVEAVSA